MRGRKPKSTRLEVVTGNHGKHPINQSVSQPEPTISDCPTDLGEGARREWHRLAGEISKLHLLTNLDRAALAAYCSAYALWVESIEAVQKFGVMIKSPTGNPVQLPYVSIANRQAEIMLKISAGSGFTPASRGRISVPPSAQGALFDWNDSDRKGTAREEV